MSIQWNKEVKWKDIAGFFNQEIKFGKIDYEKCLKTSALIALFGVIPAFTYGTVLGNLENQRLALASEVGNMQAALTNAAQTSSFANVSVDDDAYTTFDQITITYQSPESAKISVDLYDSSRHLVRNIIGDYSVQPGVEVFGYVVQRSDSSTAESYFTIRVTNIATGRYVEVVRPFQILPSLTRAVITARVSALNPPRRTVATSLSTTTKDVVLGVFDLKSQNLSSTINTLDFLLNDSNGTNRVLFYENVRVVDGTRSYNLNYTTSSASSSRLSIPLQKDVWKTLVLKADIKSQNQFKNGTIASTTLQVREARISGRDVNGHRTRTGQWDELITNDVRFLASDLSISNSYSQFSLIDNGRNASYAAQVRMAFTLTNTSTGNLYLGKQLGLSLATTSTIRQVGPIASSSLTLIQSTPVTVAGDTSTVYSIPSGTSRSFVVDGIVSNKNGTQALQEFKITKIYYSTNKENLREYVIDSGLEALRVTPTI